MQSVTIKICRKCFFCFPCDVQPAIKPKILLKGPSGSQAPKTMAKVIKATGFSQGSTDPERRLFSALSHQTQPVQRATDSKPSQNFQSDGEATGQPVQQDDSECHRLAQHAMVLGSGDNVQPDTSLPTQPTKSPGQFVQSGSTQEPDQPEPTGLALRASVTTEHGFSEALAARIETIFYKVVPVSSGDSQQFP